MGRKVGLDLPQITAAAVDLVEADGLEAATLSSVAARLGVKVPSLYNHVSGLAGLRRLITLAAVEQLTDACRAAMIGTERGDRLRATARAYRRFAVDHPGLYRALLPAPAPGTDDELYDAMAVPVLLIADALAELDGRPTGEASDDMIHVIRALRSLVHGFVDLEINGGFGMPIDIDESFERAVDLLLISIES